jgi:antitoxin VapB
MGINVKNPAVVAEIRVLAEKLGLGVTDAIGVAVRARLEQLERDRLAEIERKVAAVRAIQARVALLIPEGASSDHSDLYNEWGEPA